MAEQEQPIPGGAGLAFCHPVAHPLRSVVVGDLAEVHSFQHTTDCPAPWIRDGNTSWVV
jgi:hypothetical protein